MSGVDALSRVADAGAFFERWKQTGGSSPRHWVAAPKRHRTIWISDTHLGTRGCKAELLLNFLVHNECDMLYLVGDIVDGWRLSR